MSIHLPHERKDLLVVSAICLIGVNSDRVITSEESERSGVEQHRLTRDLRALFRVSRSGYTCSLTGLERNRD